MATSAAKRVSSGVTSNGITLTAGNDLEVFGRTLYTTIDSGGVEAVFAGGAAVASTINDGAQEVTSGGEAILTTIGSGGLEIVMTGSEAALTTVEAGGYELIWGGVGIGATLSGARDQHDTCYGVDPHSWRTFLGRSR